VLVIDVDPGGSGYVVDPLIIKPSTMNCTKTSNQKLEYLIRSLCPTSTRHITCKVMHIGQNNNKAKYEINGKYLDDVIDERDLGVVIQNDLKY